MTTATEAPNSGGDSDDEGGSLVVDEEGDEDDADDQVVDFDGDAKDVWQNDWIKCVMRKSVLSPIIYIAH